MNQFIKTAALLAAAGLAAPAQAETSVSTDGGIKIKGDKASFELDGRVQWDFALFDNDPGAGADAFYGADPGKGGENVSGSEFRRIRLTAKGKAYGWEYKIQPDFADDALTMKDVYIATKLGFGKLTMGQFKMPFGLEELTSSKWITLQERASTSTVAPVRQQGVQLSNSFGGFTWAAAGYNIDDNDGEFNNGTGLGARVTFAPVLEDAAIVHLGLAAATESYGNSSDGDNNRFRIRYRAAGHLSDASRPTLLDLNNGRRSDVTKLGFEAAGVLGPFSLQTEYAMADADDGVEEGEFTSYYLQASWIITGESRGYKAGAGIFDKVKPASGTGAWELAVRMDVAEGQETPLGGALTRDTEFEALTLGVNWYVNPNTRITVNYIDAEITDQLTRSVVDQPSALTGRVQFAF